MSNPPVTLKNREEPDYGDFKYMHLAFTLAPLYSKQTELSIHAKNSILMKNSQQSLFLEQVTNVYDIIYDIPSYF